MLSPKTWSHRNLREQKCFWWQGSDALHSIQVCKYRCTQSPSWPAQWMRFCLCNRSVTKVMEFRRETTVSHLVDTPSKIGCFLSPGTKMQRWRDCGIKHVHNNKLTLWLGKSTMVNLQCGAKMPEIIHVPDRMWSNGWHIHSQLFQGTSYT